MAKLNKAPARRKTHEGGTAGHISPIQELRRTVLSCLLWEDGFYESGESVANRIKRLVANTQVPALAISLLAVEAREAMRLRHVPLLLVRELARRPDDTGSLVSETLKQVIQRPDEITEFLAIYWSEGRQPLAKQVKKGIAEAFTKFDAYQLAKYNRDGAIKLRDALFMVHACPKDEAQAETWKQLVDGTLAAPDTWEVSLSGGADKRETFERLLKEGKLGYMALLRNLRNMKEAGVPKAIVKPALIYGAAKSKALPFRYIASARAVPGWEDMLDEAMQLATGGMQPMEGRTVVLVDVSYSMRDPLSSRSQLSRMDAACALAILLRGISNDCAIYSFSSYCVEVPPRQGFALADAIVTSQPHQGTALGQAVTQLDQHETYDRLIVITDEQTYGHVPAPKGKGYLLNIGVYENGVGFGAWQKINGFSESVVRFIQALEAERV